MKLCFSCCIYKMYWRNNKDTIFMNVRMNLAVKRTNSSLLDLVLDLADVWEVLASRSWSVGVMIKETFL